jgi:hypothetical protein
MRSICLLQQFLGGKVRGAEYREANRSGARDLARLPEIRHYKPGGHAGARTVYIVDRTRKILTNVVLRSPELGQG